MNAFQVVRQFYAHFAEGDAAAALRLLSPAVEWIEAEASPYYTSPLHGPDEVVAKVFQPLAADFDDFAAVPVDFVTEGGRVVSFGTYSGVAKATSCKLLVPFVHSWSVADGLIYRFQQYTDSTPWNWALGRDGAVG